MKITVRYFALLRERAGRELHEVVWEDPQPTLERLREHLAGESPVLAETLLEHPLICTVNREYAAEETVLKDGDEVAIFPPVTGG